MFKIESGVLDKTRLVSNILLIVLVASNIFFSIQYIESIKQQNSVKEEATDTSILVSRFLKLFVDVVLNTESGSTISYDNRVQLENDIRQIKDADLIKQWDAFVDSKDAKVAQKNAIILMKALTNKLILK